MDNVDGKGKVLLRVLGKQPSSSFPVPLKLATSISFTPINTKRSIFPLIKNAFEISLKKDLLEIANQDTDTTLARVLPSLNSLGFANGKEIETAVLYIDIRDSTSITSAHVPENAAKMYKMFHKAMVLAGKKYGGKIGGFAGDRIMIVFPFGSDKTPRLNSIKTAIYMQHILSTVLNPILQAKFTHPLQCGIGIDFGKMLVVRVGQQGVGNNDRIWAGKPANEASKLADKSDGIIVSKRLYDGMTNTTLKTAPRTWQGYVNQDKQVVYYKYTGIVSPV